MEKTGEPCGRSGKFHGYCGHHYSKVLVAQTERNDKTQHDIASMTLQIPMFDAKIKAMRDLYALQKRLLIENIESVCQYNDNALQQIAEVRFLSIPLSKYSLSQSKASYSIAIRVAM